MLTVRFLTLVAGLGPTASGVPGVVLVENPREDDQKRYQSHHIRPWTAFIRAFHLKYRNSIQTLDQECKAMNRESCLRLQNLERTIYRDNIVSRQINPIGCKLLLSGCMLPDRRLLQTQNVSDPSCYPFLDSTSPRGYVSSGHSFASTSSHRHRSPCRYPSRGDEPRGEDCRYSPPGLRHRSRRGHRPHDETENRSPRLRGRAKNRSADWRRHREVTRGRANRRLRRRPLQAPRHRQQERRPWRPRPGRTNRTPLPH
jgi:hypothetical protein